MVSTSSLAALGWPPTIEPENFHSETSFVSNTIVAETSDEEEYFFPAREDTSASNPDRYLKQKISTHGKLAYVVYSGCSAGGVFYNWYVHIISSNLFANLKLLSQDCSRASHFWARIFKQDLQRIFFLRSCPFCLGWVYKHWLPPIWCCYELRYKAVPYSSKPFGTSCFCFTQYPTTFLYLFHPNAPHSTRYPHCHPCRISHCSVYSGSEYVDINTRQECCSPCHCAWGGFPSWPRGFLGGVHGHSSGCSPRTVSSYSCVLFRVR